MCRPAGERVLVVWCGLETNLSIVKNEDLTSMRNVLTSKKDNKITAIKTSSDLAAVSFRNASFVSFSALAYLRRAAVQEALDFRGSVKIPKAMTASDKVLLIAALSITNEVKSRSRRKQVRVGET